MFAPARLFVAAVFACGLLLPSQAAAGYIAYEKGYEIWVAYADGANPHKVLDGPLDSFGQRVAYRNPQVSPDGQMLAFNSECAQALCGSFDSYGFTSKIDGTEIMGFAALSYSEIRDVRWGPSGRVLVHSMDFNGDGDYAVGITCIADAVTHEQGKCPESYPQQCGYGCAWVNFPNGDERRPSASGDGTMVAFDAESKPDGTAWTDGTHIYIWDNPAPQTPASTRHVTQGSNPSFSCTRTSGACDAAWIVFEKKPGANKPTQIYRTNLAGTTVIRLTQNRWTDKNPEVAADGRVYFTRCDNSGCHLYRMNIDGSGQQLVIANAGSGASSQGRTLNSGVAADLLKQYSPYMKYDSGEAFLATAVETMTDNGRTTGGAAPGNTLKHFEPAPDGTALKYSNNAPSPFLQISDLVGPPSYPFVLPGTTGFEPVLQQDYVDLQGNDDLQYQQDFQLMHIQTAYSNKLYGRVVEQGGVTWLQYWFFYYNNPKTFYGRGKHEGDWEMIQVRLDANGAPDLATYAQHHDDDAESCPWSSVQTRLESAQYVPVVWVALEAHASYFRNGQYGLGQGTSDSANGASTNSIRPTLIDITGVEADPSHWTHWPGHWGGTNVPQGGWGSLLPEQWSAVSPQGPMQPQNAKKWNQPNDFNAGAEACGSDWFGATVSRASPAKTRETGRRARGPAPTLTARKSGSNVIVNYRFAKWPSGRKRIIGLTLTVHPSGGTRYAPSARSVRISRRRGRVVLPVPAGPAPYTARGTSVSADGGRSRVVSVRVR